MPQHALFPCRPSFLTNKPHYLGMSLQTGRSTSYQLACHGALDHMIAADLAVDHAQKYGDDVQISEF